MKTAITSLLLLITIQFTAAQNDTIYGMNFTTGNLQFASLQISTGNTTLYGNGPVTPDIFQSGVYDFDPVNKRYFYPRGFSNSVQLICIDANTGSILNSPGLSNPTPSVIPITNIAYNWINDTLYGTHHAFENGQTTLRFARADIQTGDVEIINNTPISTSPYIAGNTDIDPINGRYFLINGSRIITVDIRTGAVTSNANIQFPLGTGSEYLVNIAYNWSNGLIYGLYMYPSAPQGSTFSYLKLAVIEPTSGLMSVISQNPLSQDGFSAGDCDIDVIGNRYFYIRQGNLHLVDLTTGALLNIQSIQNPNNAIAPIINMAYDDLLLPQSSPAARILSDTIYKLPGETVEIDAYVNQTATYNWSNGSTTSSISTSQPGNYSVSIMANGVNIYGETVVINQGSVSLEEFESKLKIYPNPSNGIINLDLSDLDNDILDLNIVTLEGKTILSKDVEGVNNENFRLDLSELPKGYYNLQLRSRLKTISRSILLQ